MHKYIPILLLISLTLCMSGLAQQKKGITHEDLWMMKRVGPPETSPDGLWAVFNVMEPAYDEKEVVNDLWIVKTDGSAKPRRLTYGKGGETGYAWSPDGKYVAFSAKREGDEAAQVYLLNMKEGGDAQRLTNLSTGATAPKWSPDSKRVLFTSRVYPGCYTDSASKKMEEEKKKIKYKAKVYQSFPIRNFDKWLDEKQTHVYVQSIEPGSRPNNVMAQVSLSKKEGFSLLQALWSPDGKDIVFTATEEGNTLAYQEPTVHIYKVNANGGEATALTTGKDEYSGVEFSSDEKYLVCLSNPVNAYKVYNLARLTRFDWPSMQNKTLLAEKLDRPINSYSIHNNTLYMSVEDQGVDKLYAMPLNGGEPKALTKAVSGSYTNISVAGNNVVVANYENATVPTEAIRVLDDGSHQALSDFNAAQVAQLDLPPVETFWTTSSRGKKVRSVLVRPAGFDPSKKYPLFVVIHGGPAGSWKDNWGYRWNYHLLAQPGYVLVLTDYTGSTGYGEKFSQDIQFDPFKGPAQEIGEAAADAIKRYSFIDGTRQAAGGASYGGHLVNWLQGTTTHYKCLISHAGLVNSVSQWGTSDFIYSREVMNGGVPWIENKTWKEQNPYRFAPKFKTPMLITVGEIDYRVPINNSIENFHILQRLKVPSKLIVFPEENHWILRAENSRFFYGQVQQWLAQYIK